LHKVVLCARFNAARQLAHLHSSWILAPDAAPLTVNSPASVPLLDQKVRQETIPATQVDKSDAPLLLTVLVCCRFPLPQR
jgi:hypothetical protein